MKVLLTGAGGFLGRHVLKHLTDRGIETISLVYGRAVPGPCISLDLLEGAGLDEAVARTGATHLLHLAWYVAHGKFWQSSLNQDWAEASVRLVEAFCKAGGRHVVAAGTCSEYAHSDQPAREDATPVGPDTPYAVAKDAARRRVMDTCERRGVSCSWARVYLPYGEGERPQRLIPSLIAALKGLRPPFGVNRTAERDFIYVTDAAEAFAVLIAAEKTGIFNVSRGEGVRIEDVVRELAAQLGVDPSPILTLPSARPGEPKVIVGECGKLKDLGWRPQVTLKEGLRRAIADHIG